MGPVEILRRKNPKSTSNLGKKQTELSNSYEKLKKNRKSKR